MATKFNAFEYVGKFRHLDSMTLLSYRDALRAMNLTVQMPRKAADPDERQLVRRVLVDIIDTTRLAFGMHTVKGTHEMAIDHHIAVNVILAERGFTSRIDELPTLSTDLL